MRLTRSAAVLSLSTAALLLGAGPASAHVTVHGPEAIQGGFAKITFQVPNEKDIPTTKVEVQLPAEQPLAFVSVKPHAGWAITTATTKLATPLEAEGEKITEAVTRITWTAKAGQGIKQGEFDEFDISGGFLPKAGMMVFKALQTYSDGSVVRWIQPTPADGSEPEFPAPVLTLAAADAEGAGHDMGATPTASASASPSVSASPAAVAPDAAASSDVSTARGLGAAGLGAGAAGLLLGLIALVRTRKP